MLEKELLRPSVTERMIEADSYESALRILGESRFSDAINHASSPDAVDEILDYELNAQAEKVLELTRYPEISRIIFLAYDVHNLKVLVKAVIDNKPQAEFEPLLFGFGTISPADVQEYVRTPSKNPQDTPLKKAVAEAAEAYAEKHDGQALDLIFDRAYFEELTGLAKAIKIEFFDEYVKDFADFNNVSIFLRMRRQDRDIPEFEEAFLEGGRLRFADFRRVFRREDEALLPLMGDRRVNEDLKDAYKKYLENGSIPALERARESHALALALKGSKALYGPEVIFGYVVRVETEIRNVRIILSGKRAELPQDAIRERIREANV